MTIIFKNSHSIIISNIKKTSITLEFKLFKIDEPFLI